MPTALVGHVEMWILRRISNYAKCDAVQCVLYVTLSSMVVGDGKKTNPREIMLGVDLLPWGSARHTCLFEGPDDRLRAPLLP